MVGRVVFALRIELEGPEAHLMIPVGSNAGYGVSPTTARSGLWSLTGPRM